MTNEKLQQVADQMGVSIEDLTTGLLNQMASLPPADIKQAYHSIHVLISTKCITQKECMLQILRSHDSVTNKQVYDMGITNPAYLVHQLQMSGYNIQSKWAYPDRSPRQNHKVYTLIEKQTCAAS